MRIAIAVLADAANAREGLINVLAAGINRLARPQYPAPMAAQLVLLAELSVADVAGSDGFEVDVRIQGPDGSEVARAEAQIGYDSQVAVESGKAVHVPLVLDLSNALMPEPGTYQISAQFGSLGGTSFEFYMETTPVAVEAVGA